MHDAASPALSFPPGPSRSPTGRPWSITLSWENTVGAACFVFLLWASTGLRAVLPAFFAGERFLWLIADLVVVAWFVLFPGQVFAYSRRNKILVCWALLACLSTVWSLNAPSSLYYGLQLFFTILMGFLLCQLQTRTQLIKLLFLALLPTQFLSLYIDMLAPHMAPGFPGGGAFTHKNVLGGFMLLQIITSLCLLSQSWRPMLTGGGFLLAVVLLVKSESASSLLIAVLVGGGVLPMALVYRANDNFARACVGIGCVVAAALAVLIMASGYDLVQAVLGSVGKDATLTGRTVLWDFGWQAFLEKPWLGYGFRAYWESEKTTVLLLRYVMQQDLEIFHNNFVEVAVAFGISGPILLILGILAAFFRSAMEFLRTRSMSELWSALFVIFVVSLAFAENPLFNNHGFLQVLFVVAMAARDPEGTRVHAPTRQRN
jgi:exopolysaccharide production protein ExoQ